MEFKEFMSLGNLRFVNVREHDIPKTPTSGIPMRNSIKETSYTLSIGFSIGEFKVIGKSN